MILSHDVAKSIRARFDREITNGTPPVSTYYDNLPGLDIARPTFVVVQIIDGETINLSLGALADPQNSTCFRKEGILQVDIYAHIETGTAESRQLADRIAQAFIGAREDAVTFFVPSDRPFGVEAELFRHMVEIPWKAEG